MLESAVTKKGQTTLPKPVRDTLGVKAGDVLVRYLVRADERQPESARVLPESGGPGFSDLMVLAAAERSGALYTLDRKAARLEGVELLR